MSEKIWRIKTPDNGAAEQIAKQCGLSLLASKVMAARGYTPEEASALCRTDALSLHDPFLLRDMDKAASVVREAVENGDMICVFGDYDCDGVVSTVMLHDYLGQIGARVCYYIPHREKEGYGLNEKAVRDLAVYGVRLIITVDNGVSALEEIALAKELGMKVVVTDHHKPRPELPCAEAVVDPHRKDDNYPCPNLCGAGVAFKLICALEGESGYGVLEEYGDLLAIATVADVVDLTDENRIFTKRGLELLSLTERPGLRALLERASLSEAVLTSESIAFGLAPRINAAGRIDSAEIAVMLLQTESESEARELSAQLEEFNIHRRALEKVVIDAIAADMERADDLTDGRLIVLDGEGWNAGVVGIVCSRLVERFSKPCIVIAKEGDTAKGSGRSVEGFSLIDAVAASSGVLTRYGGHPMAAGFSLKAEDIPEFHRLLEEYAANHHREMPPVTIDIDCVVTSELLTVDEVKGLSSLEPFGCGNDQPVFAVQNAKVERVTPLSEGKHTKLTLLCDKTKIDVLFFSVSPKQLGFAVGDVVNAAFTASLNTFRGEMRVSLYGKDICEANGNQEELYHERQLYEMLRRGEISGEEFIPDREEAAAVYRYLRERGSVPFEPQILYHRVSSVKPMRYVRFRLIIDILTELGILIYQKPRTLAVAPKGAKVDLNSSVIVRRLSNHD